MSKPLIDQFKELSLSRKILLFGFVLIAFLIWLANPSSTKNTEKENALPIEPIEQTTESSSTGSSEGLFLVTRVIDGDTIELSNGDRVRYIGIDTPEKDICYFQEASQKNSELVLNKQVKLEKDVSETDRYGRLLRYVYIDNIFVNELLVREGYANASSYPPDVKYQEVFTLAEQEARTHAKGLWGSVCNQPTTETSTPVSPPIPADTTCKYSCPGPDKDCADFSTRSEAQQFFECCGFSAGYDPMRLDNARGKGNGLACESLP